MVFAVLLLVAIGVCNAESALERSKRSLPGSIGYPDVIRESIARGVADVRDKDQFEQMIFQMGANTQNQGMGAAMTKVHGQFTYRTRGRRQDDNRQRQERAEITIRATGHLSSLLKMSVPQIMSNPALVAEFTKQMSPICQYRPTVCNPKAYYRTADGSCNNLAYPEWGRSNRAQKRLLPPVYLDGISAPRILSVTGKPLPSARTVSNFIHNGFHSEIKSAHLTVMTMSFGQFIDHDLHLTPMLKGANGSDVTCCNLPPDIMAKRAACFPIHIPIGDMRFKKRTCMNLVRSIPSAPETCSPSYQDQTNEETSFMDASQVYGSTLMEQRNLRLGKGGFLRMGPFGMMPPHPMDVCIKEAPGDFCFDAGDDRTTEVPSLAVNHLTMVREHNRLAKMLGSVNPHWSDERIFQEARKIVSASLQHMTYNEYLPKVLSPIDMKRFGLLSSPDTHHTCYDPSRDPTISNIFGVAAFRFGHSQIPDIQSFLDKKYHVQTDTPIEFTFNRPKFLLANKGCGADGVARWLASDTQTQDDRIIQEGVRSLLFLDSQTGMSFDLPALNIQRARDHGIASYNAWRKWCGLKPAYHFAHAPGGLIDHTPEAAKLLATVYKHPDDIDVFPGGLSEMKVPGGAVGPLFSCLIAREFQTIKYGDRFWYENNFPKTGFTPAQLQSVKQSSRLSRTTCYNTDMPLVQPDIFSVPTPNNPRIPCYDLPDIDISLWKEIPTMPIIGIMNPGYLSW